MTASELLKILDGVPDEACGPVADWRKGAKYLSRPSEYEVELSIEYAAAGAMVSWLTNQYAMMISNDPDECVDRECRWTLIVGDNESDSETAHGATLLEALSAAILATAAK